MKESFLGKSKITVSLGLRGLPGYRTYIVLKSGSSRQAKIRATKWAFPTNSCPALAFFYRNQAELWKLSNLFQTACSMLNLASSLGSLSQMLPAQKQTQVWEAEIQ